ncbi:hypothetical protein [Campylobacter lari]|uniref:hypothetical protein n=1 Tax=Campylobacter TaxID=194 RepID=UPI000B3F9274|nr:hypothetical protein [Campylobacter lari]MCR6528523.1 hypothetical protein [Campylobacter lari]MCR6557952.1 hypothetical protein [Campylobacter lari]
MKVIVHIGTPKTATTSIQNFFAKNKQFISKQKFYYPTAFRVANRHWVLVDFVKHCLDKSMNECISSYNFNFHIKKLQQEMQENSDSTFVFSSEGFVWEFNSKNQIETLNKVLKRLGFSEIVIIVYIRDILDYLISNCSQDVKNNLGFYSDELNPEVHPKKHIFDYRWICETYSSVFGDSNFIVRLFDQEEFYQKSFIKDFLHQIGLKYDEKFYIPDKSNESLNLYGVLIQKNLNKILSKEDINNSLLQLTSKYFTCKHEKDLKYIPEQQVLEKYYEFYENSNEWVRKKYFPHRIKLFSKSPLNFYNGDKKNQLKIKDIEQIVAYIADIISNKNKTIKHLRKSN